MLIDAADADGDGNIDYEEFGNMLFERTKKLHNRQHILRCSLQQQSKLRKLCARDDSATSVEVLQGMGKSGTTGPKLSVMTALITALGVLFITVNIVLVYINE